MDAKELLTTPADKVRRDADLMQQYIDLFTTTYGSAPNCAPCTFTRDWNKLKSTIFKSEINPIKPNVMAAKYKVKPKHNGKIFTFAEGKKVHRIYGRKMTDDFAERYISNTKDENPAQYFDKLPKADKSEKAEKTTKSKK